MPIRIKRSSIILKPDQSRVLLRPFSPGDSQRIGRIIDRIMSIPEVQIPALLEEICADFSQRHQHIRSLFLERFEQVREVLPPDQELSDQRRQLIGSYFLAEYSLESAALFNPSIIPHPDQMSLPPGALRFILSLRATGEGHISSITFRTPRSSIARIVRTRRFHSLACSRSGVSRSRIPTLFGRRDSRQSSGRDSLRRAMWLG